MRPTNVPMVTSEFGLSTIDVDHSLSHREGGYQVGEGGSNHIRFNELTISLLIRQAWPFTDVI